MSKCREAFESYCEEIEIETSLQNWTRWQAAWNARGKVDAEICRERGNHASAEVIEKENEK